MNEMESSTGIFYWNISTVLTCVSVAALQIYEVTSYAHAMQDIIKIRLNFLFFSAAVNTLWSLKCPSVYYKN